MIATLVAIKVPEYYGRYLDRQANLMAVDQMSIIADAATGYIKDNYAAVAASATPSAPAVITTAMLRSTGYLPTGFADQNSYGQDYRVLAIEPTPNKLQTLIVTLNGETIKEMHLIDIAKQIGAKGGYIPMGNTAIATGSFGGWQTPLAPYGVTPGAGHLAAALFFDDGALVNDYLYRHAVPGQPELQTMHAAINMNTNDLNNTGVVNAASVNVSGNTRTAGETYTGGWFRNTGNAGLYNETYNGGWYMTDPAWVRSYANKGVYTGGEMMAGKLTSTGRAEVGEYLQLNAVASLWGTCSPNGLLSRDATGRPLSCQSGYWLNVGSKRVMTLNAADGGITSFVTGFPYSMSLGWHTECFMTRFGDAQGEPARMTLGQVTPISGPDILGRYLWQIDLNAPVGSSIAATCFTDQ